MRVGGTQQHAAYSVRHFRTGRSDLLTARFGVRISVPEPILNLRLRCERLRASAVHPLYILRTSIDAGQTATVLLRVLELRRSHSYWGTDRIAFERTRNPRLRSIAVAQTLDSRPA